MVQFNLQQAVGLCQSARKREKFKHALKITRSSCSMLKPQSPYIPKHSLFLRFRSFYDLTNDSIPNFHQVSKKNACGVTSSSLGVESHVWLSSKG